MEDAAAIPVALEASPSRIEPVSGSWSVAMVRISVDLPAPFGPRRPNMPRGIVRLTSVSACTRLAYVFERFLISSCITTHALGRRRSSRPLALSLARGRGQQRREATREPEQRRQGPLPHIGESAPDAHRFPGGEDDRG